MNPPGFLERLTSPDGFPPIHPCENDMRHIVQDLDTLHRPDRGLQHLANGRFAGIGRKGEDLDVSTS